MNERQYEAMLKLGEAMEERWDYALKSGALADLLHDLLIASGSIPEGQTVQLSLGLTLLDQGSRGGAWLDLAERQITCDGRGNMTAGGNLIEAREFLVDGGVRRVPSGACPHCWQIWPVPFSQDEEHFSALRRCLFCGMEVGRNVRHLIRNNRCPNCVLGELSQGRPRCEICGLEANVSLVVWR